MPEVYEINACTRLPASEAAINPSNYDNYLACALCPAFLVCEYLY